MKRILCIVCCIALFSGCTVIKENNDIPPQSQPGSSAPAQTAEPAELRAALYFLNAAEDKLIAEIRPVLIAQDSSPAETVIGELINGPKQEGIKKVVTTGVKLDYIEVSDDLADIYMKTNGNAILEKEMFNFQLAAAGTLTDLLGITFVNVFWDGVYRGFYSGPAGPAVKYTGSLGDAWAKAQSQKEAEMQKSTKERKVVLYFAAKDGSYILPEMRNIVFTNDNYAEAILAELIRGPKFPNERGMVLNKNTVLQSAEFSGNSVLLNFSSFARPSEFGDLQTELLSYASIVYSLTGFIPDLQYIRFAVEGEEVLNLPGFMDFPVGMQRPVYKNLLGKSIKVYLMLKDSSLLMSVTRTVQEAEQWTAKNRLAELMKGPKNNDGGAAWPIIPAGVNENDILSVTASKDIITVDLSENFMSACKNLSEESETLLVYGIVNTLTQVSGIKKVKFLIQGKEITKLAGYLYMKSPLFKNPGLIKNNQ